MLTQSTGTKDMIKEKMMPQLLNGLKTGTSFNPFSER